MPGVAVLDPASRSISHLPSADVAKLIFGFQRQDVTTRGRRISYTFERGGARGLAFPRLGCRGRAYTDEIHIYLGPGGASSMMAVSSGG